ncbi:MAG: SDR family oxidoreductase, partial [Burkholderiales bacterium]|nr:SDR family oxidoreductase [Anaerolineae bacterium]
AVAPTWVATELTIAAFETVATTRDKIETAIPLGRIAQVEDIARAVTFLASDDASMITAQTLFIDGGFLAGAPTAAIT